MRLKVNAIACLVLAAWSVHQADSSAEVMKKISVGFGKAMEECRKELNLQDDVLQDLYNFWKEDYELLKREVGCTLVCLSKKLDLMDTDGKLHHGNAKEFAKAHGADEEMAQQLVDMIHDCEKKAAGEGDHCMQVLEVAKCFRSRIHELKWAPEMDVLVEEVLTEI